MPALDRALLLVVGKGGVGRSTVAICLALAAARLGQRVCVVELYGADAVPKRFGMASRTYAPRTIAPGVDTVSLTPLQALDEYGTRKLKLRALARLMFQNRVMQAFIDAVPGLHDVFQLGKVVELMDHYDLVVVDAPATGHGLTLLQAASSMRDMTARGLIFEETHGLDVTLSNAAQTGLVLVTLPAPLPVNESLQLVRDLAKHQRLLCGVVVSQVRPTYLPSHPPWPVVRQALLAQGLDPSLGDEAWDATQRERRALNTLREGLDPALPIVQLPRIEPQELTADDLPGLAAQLVEPLGRLPDAQSGGAL